MPPPVVRVWDLPTRLFHWLLAALVIGAFVTGNIGGNAIAWHFRCGYAILALVLFRIIWGFAGPHYARFASFPPNPLAALRYLRGASHAAPGHNPLGAFSVYALLLALALQVGTGLFANDAIMWDGPLKKLVTGETSDFLTKIHHINRFVIFGLVVLHLAAIVYYGRVKKMKLVRAMVGGDAELAATVSGAPLPQPADDGAATRLRGLVVLAVCAAAVWALVTKV